MTSCFGFCFYGIRDLLTAWYHYIACGGLGIEGDVSAGFIVDFYPDEIVEGGETGVLGECDL